MKKTTIILIATIFIVLTVVIIINLKEKKPLYSTTNLEALTHYKSGINYTLMYYIKEAKKEFEIAIKQDPSFPLPYLYQIAISMGPKEGKIAEYYKKIAVPQKNWTDFEKEFISIFMEFTSKRDKLKGNKIFAEKLEKFINKYANRVEIYPVILPMYQSVIGDKNKLIEYYNYLHEKYPNNTQVLNRLGYLYLEKRDYKNAENCFKKYIFIEPNNANPYDSIADLYFTLGDYEKAIKNYEKALKIKPDFYNSKIKLALCNIYTGKLNLAEKMINELSRWEPENPFLSYASYSIKALIYSFGGEKEKMKNLYLNFNPPPKYSCFKIPISAAYAILQKDKKLLSESLKKSSNCYKFIKEMVNPLKIQLLIWENKEGEAEKLINSTLKKFSKLSYDKRIMNMRIIANYYIGLKKYDKIQPFLQYLNKEDKIYFKMLIAKSKNDRKKCHEFAKKLLQYYNESDNNFFKKKEALECLK